MADRDHQQHKAPRRSQYGETWKAEADLEDGGDDGTCFGRLANELGRDLSCTRRHVLADRERPFRRVLERLGSHLGHASVAFQGSSRRRRTLRGTVCERRNAVVVAVAGGAGDAAVVGMTDDFACSREGYHTPDQRARLSLTWASCEPVRRRTQPPGSEFATEVLLPCHAADTPGWSARASECTLLVLGAGILELL